MRTRLLAGCLFAWACAACLAGEVTTEALLKEMPDLQRLAVLPEVPYTCKQFSSYDRGSKLDAQGKRVNWFANGDYGKYLRIEKKELPGTAEPEKKEEPGKKDEPAKKNEREECVMAEMEGPGAIVRIWSANPDAGKLIRIYLDGAEQPVLEMPFKDLTSGKGDLFKEPFAGMRSRGANLYFPFPYAKSCKVTLEDPKKRVYYTVDYRTFPKNAPVRTFKLSDVEACRGLIAEVAGKLPVAQAARQNTKLNAGEPVPALAPSETLEPGKPFIKKFTGPAAIVALRASLAPAVGEAVVTDEKGEKLDLVRQGLRRCLLTITFDGAERPQVMCPLGDLFGAGPGANPYASLPCGVTDSGTFYSRWVMPFEKSAEIQVLNTWDRPFKLGFDVQTEKFAWSDRALHFHAKWRQEDLLKNKEMHDYAINDVSGAGRHVGTVLEVCNHKSDWWGEGDEKVYVDGEAFPSWFGTGSEDYFGYAWCDPSLFADAYHAQPLSEGPGNRGHTCNQRWHLFDDIPYTKTLRFDIEAWHGGPRCAYSSLAYWYARPGGKDFFEPLAAKDLTVPEAPPPVKLAGVVEGEGMKIVKKTGGNTTVQSDGGGWGFSNGEQLWWAQGKPGDELVLTFQMKKAGRYKVVGNFCHAPDYGKAKVAINGVESPAGELDFYSGPGVKSATHELGEFELKAGENTLTITLTGTNEKANPKNFMVGLDYILPKE